MIRNKITSCRLGLLGLSLTVSAVCLSAQVETINFEEKFVEISLPDTNYILNYMNVKNTDGLKFLTARMKNNATNFPMMMIKERDALPLKRLLELYESIKPEQKVVEQSSTELIKIYEQKETLRRGLDTIQNIRIAQLKQQNLDLMDINKALSNQVKESIATAKYANSGWSWSGIKDIVLGTAAGLAIGLLIGLTR
jgi:hypothetical protein